MTNGYMGKFLHIDLTRKQAADIPLPEWLAEDYIGGKGFGARLLYDLLPAGTDALAPANVLMFMAGPLTGTIAPSMRACAVTKSPLTGTFLDSYFGGYFGPEIRYAGYDGLIITGRAEEPIYLSIDNSTVEFRSAEAIWGTDSLEANAAIKKAAGDDTLKIVSIGQAGENLCRFALINCEFNRQAGRGGAGAVMGSKNLKAIALKGSRPVTVHDPKAFARAVGEANADIMGSGDCQALMETGTAYAVGFANETGLLPYKNFYDGTFDHADDIAETGQEKHLWLNSAACMGCPIRCSKMGAVRTGPYAGIITDIVEYESAALIGSNLDIRDVRAVAHLVKLCDRYGLDSMSTGAVIGFAIEAAQNGLIESPDGVVMEFGNPETAEYLIRIIAHRDGELGRRLAEGVKRAAEQIGHGADRFAVHVKGLESPAWGPRGVPGMGLALMTADRGGCHQRGFPVAYEVGGVEWDGQPVEALALEGKAAIVFSLQNYAAGTDTLVKCDFGGFGVSPESYAKLLSAATGRNAEPSLFDETGERICNLTRLFNLREGMTHRDDTLPRRFVEEALPSGPSKGHRITEDDMDFLRQDYYRVRGWDAQGRPADETLDRLKLKRNETLKVPAAGYGESSS